MLAATMLVANVLVCINVKVKISEQQAAARSS